VPSEQSKKGMEFIMKQSYLEKLEFNKIKEILGSFCKTFKGKEFANSLFPSSNKEIILDSLLETREALVLHYRLGNLPIVEIPNIENSIKMLKIGSSLSQVQLIEVANILKLARELKNYFNVDFDLGDLKILPSLFQGLYSNPNIENAVFNAIIDENTIDDKASSALAHIRKNIRNTENLIRSKLNSYLSSKFVREPVITIRSGRFVIPVKAEYRSEINGFVYDISSSGSTLFIEPMAVFDLNNELNKLHLEENIEIQKILENLSKLFFPICDELLVNVQIIGKLDFSFAKASYATEISATEPQISSSKQINLKKARHPLIDKEKVVPIDINLGQDFNCLIITGPNTGGKTVALKTVGLLCAMASAGLFIPVSEGSTIFVFDHIFADIGDEQSIQESLSTFSSHITTIINIIGSATENSLVLLDELRLWNRPNSRCMSCN